MEWNAVQRCVVWRKALQKEARLALMGQRAVPLFGTDRVLSPAVLGMDAFLSLQSQSLPPWSPPTRVKATTPTSNQQSATQSSNVSTNTVQHVPKHFTPRGAQEGERGLLCLARKLHEPGVHICNLKKNVDLPSHRRSRLVSSMRSQSGAQPSLRCCRSAIR